MEVYRKIYKSLKLVIIMKNKKQDMSNKELERKVVIVKQAIKELRSNPLLMKKMEKTLLD